MSKWSVIENVVIYTAIAVTSVGIAWITKEPWGLWSLLLLLFVNRR